MIHPSAVRDFLKTRRDTHVWLKNVPVEDLDRALREQFFRPISPMSLDAHQKACILLGLAYPRFAFWLDMGTGKTRVVLELLSHFWRMGTLKRGMVVCISEESVIGWEDEIKKWGFKVPYIALGNSTSDEKWQAIAEGGAGLIIATYPGIGRMFAKKTKTKRGNKLKHDLKRLRRFGKNLDAFVADESVHIGNQSTLVFKVAKYLSESCTVTYVLAGIPFGRDPMLIWAQQFIADRGESLGNTIGLFRQAFFKEKRGWFSQYEYSFDKNKEADLTRLMQHRSISYASDECFDLPPVRPVPIRVKLSKETYAYFDQAIAAIKAARGDRQKIVNIFLRVRQLSSGFIGFTDDETGEKAQITFPTNPKLAALLDQIEDMPADAKFVIFHEFTYSGRTISQELTRRKIKHGWLWGGTTNSRAILRAFHDDPPKKMGGLIVNHFLGAESLNLQRANYMHFFESPVGVIRRKQAERRCFRKGQTKHGFMYDYIATPTDQRILQFHEEGGDLLKSLIRDPYSAFGIAR